MLSMYVFAVYKYTCSNTYMYAFVCVGGVFVVYVRWRYDKRLVCASRHPPRRFGGLDAQRLRGAEASCLNRHRGK